MNITILPRPVEVLTCTIPAGAECQTQWYDDVDTYRITTTDENITNVSLYRYFHQFGTESRKYEKTVIQGLTPGYAEVYIYEYGDHIATIQTTVTAPVDPLRLSD